MIRGTPYSRFGTYNCKKLYLNPQSFDNFTITHIKITFVPFRKIWDITAFKLPWRGQVKGKPWPQQL